MKSEKTDILLISVGNIADDDRREIPLGIAFLAGQLAAHSFSYRILDLYNLGIDSNLFDVLCKDFEISIPKIIGISATSYYIDSVTHLIKAIRKYCKLNSMEIPVILGGYISLIKDVIQKTGADVLCLGEGDNTIIELMKFYHKTPDTLLSQISSLDDILGIQYKNASGNFIETSKKPLIQNLDTLAFPNFQKFDLSKYKFQNSIPMYAQRGCYNHCSFCDIVPFYGDSRIRRMSPKRIIEWINVVKEEYCIKRIDFMDDNFLNSRLFVEEFFELLNSEYLEGKEEPDIKINFQARSNEVLRFESVLKDNKKLINCIEMGTESYSQTQLDRWKKRSTIKDNIDANNFLSSCGIPYINFYLWLDQYTTIEELDENLETILECPEVPIIGTKIFIPNYVMNYEVSAIYDRLGNSSVSSIPHLSVAEEFLNQTYDYAKMINIIYLGLEILEHTPRNKNMIKEGNHSISPEIKAILSSFKPLANKLLKDRLYNMVNLCENVKKIKFSKKRKSMEKLYNYLESYKLNAGKLLKPIEQLGINFQDLMKY